MFGMGLPELVLVLFVVLLLFGAKRVPEIAKSLGKAVNAFKQGMKDGEEDLKSGDKPTDSSNKNA